jgi:glucose-6-phosphate isomerase
LTQSRPTTADDALSALVASRTASRLWQKDATLFERDRLGWLDAAAQVGDQSRGPQAIAAEIAAAGFREVYLLGMGGSSLCAEVFRDVASPDEARNTPEGVRLEVLDTTDERRIGDITRALDADRALFRVASKSGGTIEVASLEQHFRAEMIRALGGGAGPHFIAITDPGTVLATLGEQRGYRRVILNPPDIGGRYSALSQFGLVPAALLGVDLAALAESAAQMADRCRVDAPTNPGLELGAFMAAHASAGRDKLTLVLSRRLEALGQWIEQLVAESTGKHGLGVLPIVGEPRGEPDEYGPDRAFVTVHAGEDASLAAWERRIRAAGHPVLHLASEPAALGGEFVRWEVATACAGAHLGLNPFDQPDVELAKRRTRDQLDHFVARGELRTSPELVANDGCRVRSHTSADRRRDEGYIAILDYLPHDAGRDAAMLDVRRALRERTRFAVTHGIGPRYLHSTGQYHKGGPDGGRFLLVTSDDATITMVPEATYSFSVLKHAQAWGDFEALQAKDRDVLHIHFADATQDVTGVLRQVALEWLAS